MPIFSRSYIARELDRARVLFGPTQAAIDAVAQHVHLPVEDVARIAAEEAHGEALAENRARDMAAPALRTVAARSIGITAEQGECKGCGACDCGKAALEAA
jgi:hypothetical protein